MDNLKSILEKQPPKKTMELPKNHRKRFQSKLNKSLHKKRLYTALFFRVAASVLILFSVVLFYNHNFNKQDKPKTIETVASLNVLSPELGKIETYYTTAINYELSNLSVNKSNKALVDSYLKRLEALSLQYKTISKKLLNSDINEETVNDLINNLQLRLQLLLQLKEDLKQKNKTNYENKTQSI